VIRVPARRHAARSSTTTSTRAKRCTAEASVIDDDIARAILDEFYTLPETFPTPLSTVSRLLENPFRAHGLQIVDAG
jgi:hypothetical protein